VPVEDVYSGSRAVGSLTASQLTTSSAASGGLIVQSDAKYRQNRGLDAPVHALEQRAGWFHCGARHHRMDRRADLLPISRLSAAKITGQRGRGIQLRDAIAAMEETREGGAAAGLHLRWSGSRTRRRNPRTSDDRVRVRPLIVFLVLAAQYESWTLPGAVMSRCRSDPRRADHQTWLDRPGERRLFPDRPLVLIGLGAKNAVLRVSAAVDFRKQGKTIMEATILAGEQRCGDHHDIARVRDGLPAARPRDGRRCQCAALDRHRIIGGMIGETTLAMLYVPLLFYLFTSLRAGRRRAHPRQRRTHTPAVFRHADAARGARDD